MRTLGPGSVSSFLKIVVEVVYVGLCVGTAILLVGATLLLVLQPFTGPLTFRQTPSHALVLFGSARDLSDTHPLRVPALPVTVFALGAYGGALVVVFNRLRRVFETLTIGDPFHPENVARLRVIGLTLIVLEGLGYLLRLAVAVTLPRHHWPSLSLNLTAWFAILVVFVLAEVFREGARLRREAELTI